MNSAFYGLLFLIGLSFSGCTSTFEGQDFWETGYAERRCSSYTSRPLAVLYNQFQSDFGQGRSVNIRGKIENLFTPNFKKIANGQELVPTRDKLLSQLEGVQKMAGPWSVEVREVIPSICGKKWAVRYTLRTEKLGTFAILAVITSYDGNRIDKVDELFYQP